METLTQFEIILIIVGIFLFPIGSIVTAYTLLKNFNPKKKSNKEENKDKNDWFKIIFPLLYNSIILKGKTSWN